MNAMSPIIKVGDRFLAFGLNWLLFDGGDAKKPIAKASKAARARAYTDDYAHMAILRRETGVRAGFLRDLDVEEGKPKKGRLLSAAALFGTMEGIEANAIFIHPYKPLGAEQRVASVIVLYEGEIFEDRPVVRLGEIHKHIDKVIADISDLAATGEPIPFARYTTDPEQFPEATPLALDEFLAGDKEAAAIHDAKSTLGIRLLMIAILLAMGGSMGWNKYQDYQRRIELERQPAQQQGPSPAELYQRSLNAQLQQIGVTPLTFTKVALATMGQRETIDDNGYQMSDSTCTDAGVCTESWNRIAGVGTYDRFVAANEGAKIEHGQNGAEKLTFRVSIPRSATTRAALPRAADFGVAMTTLHQRYAAIGMNVTPEALKLFGLPAGVQESALPAGIGVSSMAVTMSGPIGYARELLSGGTTPELQLPSNFYVNEVSFEKLNGVPELATFKLKGTYYVQQ